MLRPTDRADRLRCSTCNARVRNSLIARAWHWWLHARHA